MLVIEPDIVGAYLVVYRNPPKNISDEDYLLDSLDEAFQVALEKFRIQKKEFKLEK